jgi:hypothetical protein
MDVAVFATSIGFRLCAFVTIYAPGFSLPSFHIFNESQGIIIGCQWLVDSVLSADWAGCVVSLVSYQAARSLAPLFCKPLIQQSCSLAMPEVCLNIVPIVAIFRVELMGFDTVSRNLIKSIQSVLPPRPYVVQLFCVCIACL